MGRGQLHYKLRIDPRVTNLEKMNLKSLRKEDLPFSSYPLIVMDLSFISLQKVLHQAWQFLEGKGRLAALIKPQFECKKEEADRGKGVIKDPYVIMNKLARNDIQCHMTVSDLIDSARDPYQQNAHKALM